KVAMSAATWSWRTTPSTKGQWATGRICCIATAMRHPCCQCSERVYHRGYHRHHLGLNPAGVKNPFTWPLPLEPGLHSSRFTPTTLLNDVSRAGAFSCARERHGDDAVACRPRTVGPHPPGRL